MQYIRTRRVEPGHGLISRWTRSVVCTLSICVLGFSAQALASETLKSTSVSPIETKSASVDAQPTSYASRSDEELTALGADWDRLSAAERRALLAEVKLRMARGGERKARVKIRAIRQYGVVRKPDGTMVRVQRQLVRVVPVSPERRTFGTGFESRARARGRVPQDAPIATQPQTPVIRAGSSSPQR